MKTETGKATTFLEREALALLHREVFQKEEQQLGREGGEGRWGRGRDRGVKV